MQSLDSNVQRHLLGLVVLSKLTADKTKEYISAVFWSYCSYFIWFIYNIKLKFILFFSSKLVFSFATNFFAANFSFES